MKRILAGLLLALSFGANALTEVQHQMIRESIITLNATYPQPSIPGESTVLVGADYIRPKVRSSGDVAAVTYKFMFKEYAPVPARDYMTKMVQERNQTTFCANRGPESWYALDVAVFSQYHQPDGTLFMITVQHKGNCK